jgi:hypothetical protein
MTVTAGTVTFDATEYCRYTIGMNTITVSLTPSGGSLLAGEAFKFSILRQAVPNWPDAYRSVMSKTVTATSADVSTNTVSCTFTIGVDDMDADGITRCISGYYNATASPVASPLTVWTAASLIYVTLMPVSEIRSEWCYGAPLRSIETMMPKFPPKNITGVTFDEISLETIPGMKPLILTYTAALGMIAESWTIAWDGGAPVVIDQVKTQYILMDELELNYASVTITKAMLPKQNITEKLLIVQGEMPDAMIARRIRNAMNSVESMMGFPLEPYLYTSMPLYPGQVLEHNKMTDHWDRVGRAVDYIVPVDGYQWPSFRLPSQWCIKMHSLYGFHSVDKIISIDSDWWDSTIDRMSGFVQLVPALASFARWTVYTHPMLAPFFMHRNIPSFWQYNATFGLPDLSDNTRAPVREVIARMAASSVLLDAQRAYQGGYGSQSTGRDGLSTSGSFNPGGPYATTIQQHQQWLQLEVPRLKAKLGGLLLGMLGAS